MHGPTVVDVQQNDKVFKIEASFEIDAPSDVVYNVMTDFDHMAKFVPNVDSSKIVSASSNTYKVKQTGNVTFGIFDIPYESVREISVVPGKEIKAKSADKENGDMQSTAKFVTVDGKTKVIYTAEWTPASAMAEILKYGGNVEKVLNDDEIYSKMNLGDEMKKIREGASVISTTIKEDDNFVEYKISK
jgi:uncharacterized membrane protein